MDPEDPYYMAWERNYIPNARTPTSATRGVHQVNTDTSMVAALAPMAKEIKELKMSAMKCEVCRGGHDSIDCPVAQQEQVDFLGNQKPPLFNSGWRNHPNFSWRSGGNPPGFQPRQNQYGGDRDGGQHSGSSSGEKEIKEMLATQTQLLAKLVRIDQETQGKLKKHDTLLRSQQYAFLDLQRTVGDIARQLTDRSGGSFLGSTETNRKASLKAVTTHNCKGVESEQTPAADDDEPVDEEIEMETPEGAHERRVPASTVPKEFQSFWDAPFVLTAKALIDVFDGKITLRVGDENVTFDVMK
ncbi:hypothetical protein L1987_63884 [Smallanthus sonchifolius]|uniref:Uncharacterized protein n=1 Tax=Smallanthus sonchifolius TaxID=185202 RepID=A0ACB9CEF2_9ASTR|nr:hypothetical protein L1987_63884 [Smallanthus sonchifolius]